MVLRAPPLAHPGSLALGSSLTLDTTEFRQWALQAQVGCP